MEGVRRMQKHDIVMEKDRTECDVLHVVARVSLARDGSLVKK